MSDHGSSDDPRLIVWGGGRLLDVVPRVPPPIRQIWLVAWLVRHPFLTIAYLAFQGPKWVVRHWVTSLLAATFVAAWIVTGSLGWAALTWVGIVASLVGYQQWRRASRGGATLSLTEMALGHWRRSTNLRKNWPTVASTVTPGGRGRGTQLPEPTRVTTVPSGLRWRVHVGKVGMTVQDLAARDDLVAGMLGGPRPWSRGPRVVETAPVRGEPTWAEQSAYWGDPLDRVYDLSTVPRSPLGHAGYGYLSTGRPALMEYGRSVFIGGQPGSGKSNSVWAFLASLLANQVPTVLYVIDSGGGVEFPQFTNLVKPSNTEGAGLFRVAAYARTPTTAKGALKSAAGALERRINYQHEHKLGDLTIPTKHMPLVVVLIDEVLALGTPYLKNAVDEPLGHLLRDGRKSLFMVAGLSQLGEVEVIGVARNMFVQRIAFATGDPYLTDTFLKRGAEARGAHASRIGKSQRGVGFSWDDELMQFERLRSIYVDKESRWDIARGVPPKGMSTYLRQVEDKSCAVYHLINAQDRVIYVGKAEDPARRYMQHRREQPWRAEIAGMRTFWYPSVKLALENETKDINAKSKEGPLYNKQQNRGQRVKEGTAA